MWNLASGYISRYGSHRMMEGCKGFPSTHKRFYSFYGPINLFSLSLTFLFYAFPHTVNFVDKITLFPSSSSAKVQPHILSSDNRRWMFSQNWFHTHCWFLQFLSDNSEFLLPISFFTPVPCSWKHQSKYKSLLNKHQ